MTYLIAKKLPKLNNNIPYPLPSISPHHSPIHIKRNKSPLSPQQNNSNINNHNNNASSLVNNNSNTTNTTSADLDVTSNNNNNHIQYDNSTKDQHMIEVHHGIVIHKYMNHHNHTQKHNNINTDISVNECVTHLYEYLTSITCTLFYPHTEISIYTSDLLSILELCHYNILFCVDQLQQLSAGYTTSTYLLAALQSYQRFNIYRLYSLVELLSTDDYRLFNNNHTLVNILTVDEVIVSLQDLVEPESIHEYIHYFLDIQPTVFRDLQTLIQRIRELHDGYNKVLPSELTIQPAHLQSVDEISADNIKNETETRSNTNSRTHSNYHSRKQSQSTSRPHSRALTRSSITRQSLTASDAMIYSRNYVMEFLIQHAAELFVDVTVDVIDTEKITGHIDRMISAANQSRLSNRVQIMSPIVSKDDVNLANKTQPRESHGDRGDNHEALGYYTTKSLITLLKIVMQRQMKSNDVLQLTAQVTALSDSVLAEKDDVYEFIQIHSDSFNDLTLRADEVDKLYSEIAELNINHHVPLITVLQTLTTKENHVSTTRELLDLIKAGIIKQHEKDLEDMI